MRTKSTTVEQEVARIARVQHGVVTRAQLLDAGVSPGSIVRRMSKGTLLPEFAGVYRVGHRAPSVQARYLAAVLACGEGAALSGAAAGHLFGLIGGKPPKPEVTAPTKRRVDGIRTRRSLTIDAAVFRGIPVTTVPRTLVDLAAELNKDDLARACHEAGVRYRTTPAQVEAVLARRPNIAGATKLRAVIRGDVRVTLSKLEQRFLDQLEQHGLPLPRTNRSAGGRRVDCRWPEHRLTVELDSYRYHHSRHAWERDRRREREAHARGDQFRRYTFGDVSEHPRPMLRELSALLNAPL